MEQKNAGDSLSSSSVRLSPVTIVSDSLQSFIGIAVFCFFIWAMPFVLTGCRYSGPCPVSDSGATLVHFFENLIPIIVVALLAWRLLVVYSRYKNFYFDFGAEKGEIRTGIIGKRISFSYDRIRDVKLIQGILGRVFGTYSVYITLTQDDRTAPLSAASFSGHSLPVDIYARTSPFGLRLGQYSRKDAETIRTFLAEKTSFPMHA